MRLIDIVSAPWAITREMHEEVLGIYGRHLRGEKIDVAALEARLGVQLKNQQQATSVDERGVAVISVEGVLAKRMNLFTQISGGASTQLIGTQFAQAVADPNVTKIVMLFDSPGGTVDGTQQLAEQVFAARGAKPIVGVVDGMCCSAAYWIASACDTLYITSDTAQVGSIGVIATHVDRSMAQAQSGVKVTEVKAGRYKGQGSPNAPLGAAEVTMQDAVDKLYKTFVTDVARNRGVSVDEVQDMAEGRVFLGQDAIAAGLVDGVATLDAVIAQLAAGNPAASLIAANPGVGSAASNKTEEVTDMFTVEKVKTDAPDVAAALIAEGAAQAAKDAGTARVAALAEGAAGERARLTGIEAQALPGCEALVAEAKADPKVTPEAFAMKVVAFMKQRNSKALANLQDDAAEAKTNHVAAPADGANPKAADNAVDPHALAAKARAYITEQAKAGRTVSAAEAVQHVSAAA